MNFKDRLQKQGGLPVGFSGAHPCFGNVYFVDSTNGSATGDGDNPSEAFSTIQLALTAQAADASALGDIIYILPGTYVEDDLNDNLAKVQIIGVSCSGVPGAAGIAPSTGNAWTGTMDNAALRNMQFRQSSGTNSSYAALAITDMTDSIVDNCHILGVKDTASSVGIRIGAESDAAWELMERAIISNCLISNMSSRTKEFDAGICFGNFGDNDNSDTRMFKSSLIFNNRINAHFHGIKLATDDANNSGGQIDSNTIRSAQGSAEMSSYGISACGNSTDLLCLVINNRIIGSNDAIVGFRAQNVLHNYISEGGVEKEESDIAQY